MAKGFDCATPLTSAKAQLFASQGYGFVGRYLADTSSRKRLTAAEAQTNTDAGLYMVSIFERWAERAGEGISAGTEDGRLGLQYAHEVGQPEGSAIYAAVDYDAQEADFDAIEAYMRAFDAEIDGYELDAYGSYNVIKMLRERGVIRPDGGMQTRAWSRGQVVDKPRIYQYDCGPKGLGKVINGVNVDLDDSNGDAGGWMVGMAVKPSVPGLPEAIADNIIDSYLSVAWDNCDAERVKAEQEGRPEDAAAWFRLREWQHTLANELRKASGQLEE